MKHFRARNGWPLCGAMQVDLKQSSSVFDGDCMNCLTTLVEDGEYAATRIKQLQELKEEKEKEDSA